MINFIIKRLACGVKKLKEIKSIFINYLTIFIPMTTLVLLPIFFFGDALGELLIRFFGNTTGLFMRPLAISLIYIAILMLLLSPFLSKMNCLLWFKSLSDLQIRKIYKNYIYGFISFAALTAAVVISTLLDQPESKINWFNSRNYLFFYLLLFLAVSPIFSLTKNEDNK